MKKILLSLLIMIIAVPAFAKDPKETVEYWKSNPNNQNERDIEMKKCWNSLRTHFKVPVGSKQWNICCAIRASRNHPLTGKEQTFEEVYEEMKKAKEKYSEKYGNE